MHHVRADSTDRIDQNVVFVVSGEVALMLEIVVRDMQHYAQVVLREVLDTRGVKATRSSFVLEEVKSIY